MWKLAPPSHSARETFETCIGRVRDPGLTARLTAAADRVAASSQEFDEAVRKGSVHKLKSRSVASNLGVKEMEKVYTQRMAKAGSPGRHVYDDILSSSPQGRCPLCTQRLASTLDHYMPKTKFPALVVAPLNLVPACSDCNKAKLAAVPTSAELVTLHPYYDDLGEEVWLRARVVELHPAAIRFDVLPPASWDAVLAARVRHHFKSFGLATLFASEAAEELMHMRHQLRSLRAAGVRDGVKAELLRRAESCAAVRPNGWRAATYRACADNRWFVDGGFESSRW